jgi:formylglycine-generating enzyme required for sulfatase activity
LDGFWIDKTEVTFAQYHKCVEAGACQEPGNQVALQPNNPRKIHPDKPVQFVSWYNARDYATWARGRLPTEAEWEKAARGIDSRAYPWGNSTPDCDKANYGTCATLLPVGHYPLSASPYGALDMAGNLWEWTHDWYEERYYDRSPIRNPKGPDQGQYRIVRGGSQGDSWLGIRCATRRHAPPVNRYPEVGFRTVIAPQSPSTE